MKSASEMSKAIRMKKKMAMGGEVMPENDLEEHMKDPIDELVETNDETTDSMDENHPDRDKGMNEEEVRFPENDALDMDMKNKKRMRIAGMMAKMGK